MCVCVWICSPRPGDLALHPRSPGRTLWTPLSFFLLPFLSLCSPQAFLFYFFAVTRPSPTSFPYFSLVSFPLFTVFFPPASCCFFYSIPPSLAPSLPPPLRALLTHSISLAHRCSLWECSNTVPSHSSCKSVCVFLWESKTPAVVTPQICSEAATNSYCHCWSVCRSRWSCFNQYFKYLTMSPVALTALQSSLASFRSLFWFLRPAFKQGFVSLVSAARCWFQQQSSEKRTHWTTPAQHQRSGKQSKWLAGEHEVVHLAPFQKTEKSLLWPKQDRVTWVYHMGNPDEFNLN